MKAIVFVDVQNDFVKGGKLAFGYPIDDNLQKIIDFAKECVNDPNCKIYATRDTHDANYMKTLEGQKLPVEHCIESTDGAEDVEGTIDEIVICGYDLSICVIANVVLLRAKFPNAKIIVKTDLCGDVDKVAFDAAIKVLQMQQIDIED